MTNDDVVMAMLAHGYGAASEPSQYIIFSNVVWGALVSVIPQLFGIDGYSWGTLLVQVSSGSAILFVLLRLGVGAPIAILVLSLILTRPILFPQFTINAGLLMIAAIMLWVLYGKESRIVYLIFGCSLAFIGFLIREQVFWMMSFLAIVLLPWHVLRTDAASRVAFVLFLVAIAAAAMVNNYAYDNEAWRAFTELNEPRVKFTDYGVAGSLEARPDILGKHGYSKNDLALLESWYFADPDIANPVKLNNMIDELGLNRIMRNSLPDICIALQQLVSTPLLPLTLLSLGLLFLMPSRRVIVLWIASIGIIVSLAILGRPGILRVYIPIVSLLLLAPILIRWQIDEGQRFGLRTLALVFASISLIFTWNSVNAIEHHSILQKRGDQVFQDLMGFPAGPTVVWGASFPFEYAYRVLRIHPEVRRLEFNSLSAITYAPNSVAMREAQSGNGFLSQFLGEQGVPLIAGRRHIDLLDTYCSERHMGELNTTSEDRYGRILIVKARCIPGALVN